MKEIQTIGIIGLGALGSLYTKLFTDALGKENVLVLADAKIDLVSEMDPDFVRSIFLTPRSSAQEALDAALAEYGPDATVLAMPFGGATLPMLNV